MIEPALNWARRGCPVFPCVDKRPLVKHGLLDATTDEATIRSWWGRWPDANLAVRTGKPSGLIVLDVDGQEGADNLRGLEREHGSLPRTASTTTPRGGSHCYYRAPAEPVKTSAGVIAPGVDVRGDGGYVLVPPSVGANGRAYCWDEEATPAEMPTWLRSLAGGAPGAIRRPEPPSTWVRMVQAGLPEKQRNAGLTRLVGHLLARDVDVRLVGSLAHLVNTRCRPPLDGDEVDRIVGSIAGREVRKRIGVTS